MKSPWFEFDDEDEVCGAFPREVLRLVRERAERWPCPPGSTYVLFFPGGETEDAPASEPDLMRLVVDLSREGSIFQAIGAEVEGDTALCTALHICDLAPTDEHADIVAREAKGSAEELAECIADWIGEVLHRPTLQYDGRNG
ncbi:hypothetical protein AB0L59_36005 [Streptomyces sp. NPDC052109]|uniref:hypothetical protein n=1 Tax=Streptomyces sp. NPDC052109 TaxID=3155527 RepID=UPI0034197444